MKLSVSLPDEDVAILDDYARNHGLGSRSAAVHKAVEMLRHPALESDYEQAWAEWEASGEEATWAASLADGLGDDPR